MISTRMNRSNGGTSAEPHVTRGSPRPDAKCPSRLRGNLMSYFCLIFVENIVNENTLNATVADWSFHGQLRKRCPTEFQIEKKKESGTQTLGK